MGDGERKAALDFAAKIRAAAQKRQSEQESAAAKEEERRKKLQTVLDRLFDDLEAMGDASGVLKVSRKGRAISLALDGRRIRIASKPTKEAPDHLLVEASGVDHTLTGSFSHELDRWALQVVTPKRGQLPEHTQVYALLGRGMEWLIEHGLGLKLG